MPMTIHETIRMAQRCREEIARLRRENDALRPKADAYDAICTVLGLLPKPSVGMSEDVTWLLNKQIEDLQRELAPAPCAPCSEKDI